MQNYFCVCDMLSILTMKRHRKFCQIMLTNRLVSYRIGGTNMILNYQIIRERRCFITNIGDIIKKYWPIIIAIAPALLSYGAMTTQVDVIKEDIQEINETIKEMPTSVQSSIDGLETSFNKELEKVDDRITRIQNQVFILGGGDPALVGLSVSDATKTSVQKCYANVDSFVETDASVQYSSVVAYNYRGEELTVEDVAEKKLLIPYMDDERECFFYGQLDRYGNWDGECIINVYQDGFLKLITEALYDGGDLMSFKQAFPNENKTANNKDVWYISKRLVRDGFSSGETLSFFRAEPYKQGFSYDDVTSKDIITLDRFRGIIEGGLEGYYRGNSSNGSFSDDSGTAYMFKFFENSTVRTFYMGKFSNGTFEDQTENAWMIGRLGTDENYSYYKGPFSGGRPTKNPEKYPENWELDIDQERINQLIADVDFPDDLKIVWQFN